MCGLAGVVDLSASTSTEDLEQQARRMGAQLVHRGPDDEGTWIDASVGVAFAFRRLSIVDLSIEGHQPMVSASGRYVIVYNGEIYNFRELRAELEGLGVSFRGHSDTEVLLASIERWGLDAALRRCNGMFAVALWDRETRQLSLARDRLGEKPLYYASAPGRFAFASEVKALRALPNVARGIDHDVLASYLRFGWIGGTQSIFRDTKRLAPGTILTIDVGPDGAVSEPRPFWSAIEAARRGIENRFAGTRADAADELESLLRDAVARRMVADVPLGAFLSGGVDSGTVVAMMQLAGRERARTFSIGFEEQAYDEAGRASAVARYLGAEHTELYVTPQDALDLVPQLPALFDEPFADPSAIPTFLLASLTRRDVTVSLSGDGGDELFAGYERYERARRIRRFARATPRPIRHAAAWTLTRPSAAAWNRVRTGLGHRVYRLASTFDTDAPDELYRELFSYWQRPGDVVLGASAREPALPMPSDFEFTEQMMFCDLARYLPDDILVKVDRATMGASLEGRVPLLDHRVVEFAWTLPLEHKVAGATGKAVLRDVLARHVPRALFDRPKMGFGVPIDAWLRGPLRAWADDMLAVDAVRAHGLVDPAWVARMWSEHRAETRNWQYPLWAVLVLQSWADTYD